MDEHLQYDTSKYSTSSKQKRVTDVTLPPQLEKRRQKKESFLLELLKFGIIAVIIVVPIRLYVGQPYIVSGASMEPTFSHGEYLIVDQLSYRFEEPKRGDVVVFRFPEDTSKFFIKRIIGLPSETVRIENGSVVVTNATHPEGLTLDEPYIAEMPRDTATVTLEGNEYFVLGDNRLASSDSRVWGPLDEELIMGRVFLRLLPVARASVLPGNSDTTML